MSVPTVHIDTACSFCNLAILKQKHVRIARPPRRGENPDYTYIAVIHNKEKGDCFDKIKSEAAKHAAERRPKPYDFQLFAQWRTQQDAKRAISAGGR